MSDERVLTQKQRRMTLQNLGQFDGGETCSFEQRPLSEHGCIFEETALHDNYNNNFPKIIAMLPVILEFIEHKKIIFILILKNNIHYIYVELFVRHHALNFPHRLIA